MWFFFGEYKLTSFCPALGIGLKVLSQKMFPCGSISGRPFQACVESPRPVVYKIYPAGPLDLQAFSSLV
jgi:hypothetical protein